MITLRRGVIEIKLNLPKNICGNESRYDTRDRLDNKSVTESHFTQKDHQCHTLPFVVVALSYQLIL